MIATQCKMARAALGLGVRDLAKAAGVSPDTVARLERGEYLKPTTVAALRTTLEAAGVIFVAENGDGPGVRLRKGFMPSLAMSAPAAESPSGREDARAEAGRVLDRAMSSMEGTDEEKADRRDRLTAVPEAVKKARRKPRPGL
ncbi:transcriptional regulator with XRE-family HTH domain [Hansschlegelia beijingensis]|uniref:Transcriptional regulator with XRE-family HTH domain n=1 Tax=Hansschlegelia beijingensis TaxID=1133344 RepID=A0A7W6D0Q1_9HYPH|nr:transcriptional regulator with XRE-family HTH domain [Hansschlegelia beijingensis]